MTDRQSQRLKDQGGGKAGKAGTIDHPTLWPCAGCGKVDGNKGKRGTLATNGGTLPAPD